MTEYGRNPQQLVQELIQEAQAKLLEAAGALGYVRKSVQKARLVRSVGKAHGADILLPEEKQLLHNADEELAFHHERIAFWKNRLAWLASPNVAELLNR